MDEKKLEYLSRAEKYYPHYTVVEHTDDFPDVFYLHEKGLAQLSVNSSSQAYPILDPEDLLKPHGRRVLEKGMVNLQLRITAHGLDAISELSRTLKKEKNLDIPEPESSGGKLEAIINSPLYREAKDSILSFLAKFAAESNR